MSTVASTTVEFEGLPLAVADPASEPGHSAVDRAVIVIQEAFGVNDHIEDVGRRFAALGWVAVAPHLYHRDGSPTFAYDDLAGARPHMAALTDEGVGADLATALAWLASRGITTER
ncbi:MAG TPA: dienelactone hydrolase family protein, partial [Ilumatobacteraceae bacterium]|nr:dienelactone hydrolase family protein [Ilumatobacteraceae bacterium]